MNTVLRFLDWITYGDNTGKAVIAFLAVSTTFAFVMSAVLP